MLSVIQRMMEAEREAKQLVQGAQDEATRLLEASRGEAQNRDAQTRAVTLQEATELVEQAAQNAEHAKADALARAAAEIETTIQVDAAARGQSLDAAFACLCGRAEKD